MNKYFFNNKDITYLFILCVQQTVEILAERLSRQFDEMYRVFLSSNTYKILQRTENLLWAEGAYFIADEYQRETGTEES
jgi:hypothetical protein